MPHSAQYDKIRARVTREFEARVYLAVKDHVGSANRIDRPRLIYLLFGEVVSDNQLSNSSHDRAIRKAISHLQEQGIPILSDSDKGGYYIGTPDECEVYLEEQKSRQRSLSRKIHGIEAFVKHQRSQLKQLGLPY